MMPPEPSRGADGAKSPNLGGGGRIRTRRLRQTAEPARVRRGTPSVHIEEEPARAARALTFAQLSHFAGLFAVLTTNRKGQGPQATLRNLVAAFETIPEGAFFQAGRSEEEQSE